MRSILTLLISGSCHISDFMHKQIALLLFHPIIMSVAPLNLLRLHLEVLIQSVESLFLKIYFSFGTCITDLFVLLHLKLV